MKGEGERGETDGGDGRREEGKEMTCRSEVPL